MPPWHLSLLYLCTPAHTLTSITDPRYQFPPSANIHRIFPF